MLIYSLDPGETSGYVIADVEWSYNEVSQQDDFQIISIVEQGTFRFEETLKHLYKARACDVLVIEDFIVRKSLIGDRMITVRVIGAFEVLFGVESTKPRVIFQQPFEKTRVNDRILSAYGLASPSTHTRDALTHLLIYLFKQRGPQNNVLRLKLRKHKETKNKAKEYFIYE